MWSSFRAGKCSMLPSPSLKPISMPPSREVADSCHPPEFRGVAVRLLSGAIGLYKVLISPLFAGCCRYYPSCADYTREAVIRHGAARGSWLGFRRLIRCQPFGGHGVDPVPERR